MTADLDAHPERSATMDSKLRKKVLRKIANGLFVLTSRHDGEIGAATVSWLSQCSFRPPLVMVALRPDSTVYRCVVDGGVAAIHILDRSQEELAQRFFATTRVEGDRINGEPFTTGTTSAPILEAVPDYLECRTTNVLDTPGDHVVVVMEVVAVGSGESAEPLTVAGSPWEYGG